MADNNKEMNKPEGGQQNRPDSRPAVHPGTSSNSPSTVATSGAGEIQGNAKTTSGGGGTATRQAQAPTTGQDLGRSYEEIRDNVTQWGNETLGQAQESVRNAYDQASQAVNETWTQARDYGRANPGQTTLIAFAVGVGVGLLLASNARSGSRSRRLLPPVMNALTEIADEFLR